MGLIRWRRILGNRDIAKSILAPIICGKRGPLQNTGTLQGRLSSDSGFRPLHAQCSDDCRVIRQRIPIFTGFRKYRFHANL
jgi:hypothetical protein